MFSLKNILFILFYVSSIFSQANNYFLSEGVIRYYTDPCESIGFACVATDFYNLGIETILEDTTINDVVYHKVLWERRYRWESEPEVSITEIEYWRFYEGILLKYYPSSDSLIQNYNFMKGDSLKTYFNHLEWANNGLPDTIIHDTSTAFSDGTIHRVMWADIDSFCIPNQGCYNTVIPNASAFIDSILVIADSNWVLPMGGTHHFSYIQPFYFIDSIGVVYSGLNHRNMALVGISFPDGRFYGRKVKFITSIPRNNISLEFILKQNYPNPFNPTTTIEFALKNGSHVELNIFDITGRKVVEIFDEYRSRGQHRLIFNGSNLAAGVYFYQLKIGKYSKIKKMLLIR